MTCAPKAELGWVILVEVMITFSKEEQELGTPEFSLTNSRV